MKIKAELRSYQGTGVSRRLRKAGSTPGVVYGPGKKPLSITLEHKELFRSLQVEAFHSSILDLDIGGSTQKVLLRDFQMHAFRQQVLHVDFLAVDEAKKINVKVPLHFVNAELSPAVKLHRCLISHVANEIELVCLPKDLPENITVDLADMKADTAIHINDITLPEGVVTSVNGKTTLVTANSPGGKKEVVAEE